MRRPTDEELREDITRTVEAMVRGGFAAREDISAAASDICDEGDAPEELYSFAAAELDRLWAAQRAAETNWPARTDCDRLDQAFAELESVGVICRQDFSCCGNCGASEIWEECSLARAKGVSVRGYAFYHQQDTESAVEGYGLFLNFGAMDEKETSALLIAREIVAVLESHGLKTEWNGAWSQRIAVALEWRRRRFTAQAG